MKDTNTTLLVGLLSLVIIVLGAFLAMTYSKVDPVVILGFAGTIVTGIFSFLRAGQAADEALRAKKEAVEAASRAAEASARTVVNSGQIQAIQVSVDGRMEQLLKLTETTATTVERAMQEQKAAEVKVAADATLAVASAAPAIGQSATPQEVTIVQAADSPVPVALATPVPVEITEVKDEGHS